MRKRYIPYVLSAAVSLFTLLIYLPALQNAFVLWDDDIYVYDNPHIRSLDWTFIEWAFSDISTAAFWHPATWLSHAVDYGVWGLNPVGHHLTSILLHAVNTFLVVLLIIKLLEVLPSLTERFIWISAALTGLFFGLHPLHVESVAWVSERKDLLCALFFLLSIMAYRNYAVAASEKEKRAGFLTSIADKRYLLSFTFFILALSSKSMAVTLPAVLLLLDWYPLRRLSTPQKMTTLLVEKVPFFLCSAVVSVLSLLGQKEMGALMLMDSVPLQDRVLVAFKAIVMYLGKMLVPFDLLPVYPYPQGISLLSVEYAGAMALVCGITAACILVSARQSLWLALWGYFVITLLPVIGLVPIGFHFMADRYMYLPSIGPFLLAGLAAAWVWTETDNGKPWGSAVRRSAALVTVVVTIFLSVLTIRQIAVWSDSLIFWNYVIEKEPERVPIAYVNRGVVLKESGSVERAIEEFSKVISLSLTAPLVGDPPDREPAPHGEPADDRAGAGQAMSAPLKYAFYLAYNNRGAALEEKGELDNALSDFAAAIALEPKLPMAHYNRGLLFGRSGQIDRAIEEYTTAIIRDAKYVDAYTNRGWMFKATGQFDRALSDYSAAIDLQPFSAQAHYNRGLLFGETGQLDHALADYSAAIDLDPRHADALTNRGLLYEDLGRFDLALADFNAAISVDPANSAAFNNRGVVFELTNRLDRAVEDYNKAIDLNPANPLAYSNRGTAFSKLGRYEEAIEDHTRAIALYPGNVRSYMDRGELYLKTGRRQRAMRDYQAACDRGFAGGCAAVRTGGIGQIP